MAAVEPTLRSRREKLNHSATSAQDLIDAAMATTAERGYSCATVVAIVRTSTFAYVELHEKADKMNAAQFLRNLVEGVSCRIRRRCRSDIER